MPRGNSKDAARRQGNGSLTKYMPSGNGGNGYHAVETKASWADIHPDFVAAAVVAVNRAGGAILFGGSRDETQFAVTLFFDGAKNTFYWFKSMENAATLEEWLSNLITDCNAQAGEA